MLGRPSPGSTHFAWALLFLASLVVGAFLSFIAFKLARHDYLDVQQGNTTAARWVPALFLVPCLAFVIATAALVVWVVG